MSGLDIEAQRALAAEMFPREWAQALACPGKRRSHRTARLRKQAVAELIMRPVRAAGGNCGNCVHRLRNPAGLKGLFCELDSDFHGYQSTAPEGLCDRYSGPAITAATHPDQAPVEEE